MSIRINREKCRGCGKCRNVCPGNLLHKDDGGKTVNLYPRDCWGCTACLKECSFGAISFFLGADLGGRGTILRTTYDGEKINWILTKPSGQEKVITVNRNKANQY
jgi:adenylylsulfate reductase subunit B